MEILEEGKSLYASVHLKRCAETRKIIRQKINWKEGRSEQGLMQICDRHCSLARMKALAILDGKDEVKWPILQMRPRVENRLMQRYSRHLPLLQF